MESILIQAVSVIIMALVGYGVSILKKRTDSEVGKQALDSIDQVIGTVVGAVSQTMAKKMRKESGTGKLTDNQKAELRMTALRSAQNILAPGIMRAAEITTTTNILRYMGDKIEERVGAGKKG
jgi:hypothetical protein